MSPGQILRIAVSWLVLLTVAPGAAGHALLHVQRGDGRLEIARTARAGAAEHWNAGSPIPSRSSHSDAVLTLSCPGCSGLAEGGALGADHTIPFEPSAVRRALDPRETRSDHVLVAWSPEAGRAPPISLS